MGNRLEDLIDQEKDNKNNSENSNYSYEIYNEQLYKNKLAKTYIDPNKNIILVANPFVINPRSIHLREEVVKEILNTFKEIDLRRPKNIESQMKLILEDINNRTIQQYTEDITRSLSLTTVILHNNIAHIANVGDNCAYHFNNESLLGEWVIKSKAKDLFGIPHINYFMQIIERESLPTLDYIGKQGINIEYKSIKLNKGDLFLIATNWLYYRKDYVPYQKMFLEYDLEQLREIMPAVINYHLKQLPINDESYNKRALLQLFFKATDYSYGLIKCKN
jgi:hypothetical protein